MSKTSIEKVHENIFLMFLGAGKLKTEQKLIVLSCLHPPSYLFRKKIGTQSHSTNFVNWRYHVNSFPDNPKPPPPPRAFIRRFWKCFNPRITQSWCKFWVTSREASFQEIYAWHVSERREWSTILRNKNMLIWKVMNPFSTPSGVSSTFHAELQMYFTLALVARKEIMVRSKKANFVRTIV